MEEADLGQLEIKIMNQVKMMVDKKVKGAVNMIMSTQNRLAVLEEFVETSKEDLENNANLGEDLEELETRVESAEKLIRSQFNTTSDTLKNLLVVPSVIGDTGKYFNFKEFVTFVDSKLTSQEQEIRKIKDSFKKTDSKIADLTRKQSQQGASTERVIMNSVTKSLEKVIDEFGLKVETLASQIEEVRQDKFKDLIEIRDNSKMLASKAEMIESFKSDVEKALKEKEDKFEKRTSFHEEVLNTRMKEIDQVKSSFASLSQFIKDVRFRKNLGGGDVDRLEFAKAAQEMKQVSKATAKVKSPSKASIRSSSNEQNLKEEPQVKKNKTTKIKKIALKQEEEPKEEKEDTLREETLSQKEETLREQTLEESTEKRRISENLEEVATEEKLKTAKLPRLTKNSLNLENKQEIRQKVEKEKTAKKAKKQSNVPKTINLNPFPGFNGNLTSGSIEFGGSKSRTASNAFSKMKRKIYTETAFKGNNTDGFKNTDLEVNHLHKRKIENLKRKRNASMDQNMHNIMPKRLNFKQQVLFKQH